MIIGVTGASGFVGRALVARLTADGHQVLPIVRSPGPNAWDGLVAGDFRAGDLPDVGERRADVVVHLAGASGGSEAKRTKTADTLVSDLEAVSRTALRLGAALGAKHFIFLSSIKALGESSGMLPLSEDSPPAPSTPYGFGKLRAEQLISSEANGLGMRWTIVRPPMVYGPPARGNFAVLARLADMNLPLPLGRIKNRRSIIYIANLCDALAHMADLPAAFDRVFHVADEPPLSTTELFRMIASAKGANTRLLTFPTAITNGVTRIPLISPIAQRLFGNLELDTKRVRGELAWVQPVSTIDAIRATLTDKC